MQSDFRLSLENDEIGKKIYIYPIETDGMTQAISRDQNITLLMGSFRLLLCFFFYSTIVHVTFFTIYTTVQKCFNDTFFFFKDISYAHLGAAFI